MKKITIVSAIFILSMCNFALASQSEQIITLKDGSQIVGQLVGINNGVYTINAPIIGNITVATQNVYSITNRNDNQNVPPQNSGPGYPGQPTAPVGPHPIGPEPEPGNPTKPYDPPENLDRQIAEDQRELLSNPRSMATLQQMMQDPEIMQALQDPALIEAVTHHDYKAVENNPNVQKLLNNPEMKALLEKLMAQQQHHDHDGDHDHDPNYGTNPASSTQS